MRLLIVTDAWTPQVNGVVVSLQNTIAWLQREGHEVRVVEPGQFISIPCPTYPEIRLALAPRRRVSRIIDSFVPEAIHIATEGPLGLAARRHCVANGLPFTTAYHTQFPRYVRARAAIPIAWTYRWLRWFHRSSSALMTTTPAMRDELRRWKFDNVVHWGKGVDTEIFHPRPRLSRNGRPVFLYVGRLAVEKNLDAFLALDLPGTKIVVGDGPERRRLQRRYPDAVFAGARFGTELAGYYCNADVFVFPSRTDTFGLVLAEAMACGTPVAAYPVTGPIDVVTDPRAGVLDADLRRACLGALALDRNDVARFGRTFSWQQATSEFMAHVKASARPVQSGAHASAASGTILLQDR